MLHTQNCGKYPLPPPRHTHSHMLSTQLFPQHSALLLQEARKGLVSRAQPAVSVHPLVSVPRRGH
jgi:hypothetical protein